MYPSLRSMELPAIKYHAAVINDSVDEYLITWKEISMLWNEKDKVTKQDDLLGLKT